MRKLPRHDDADCLYALFRRQFTILAMVARLPLHRSPDWPAKIIGAILSFRLASAGRHL